MPLQRGTCRSPRRAARTAWTSGWQRSGFGVLEGWHQGDKQVPHDGADSAEQPRHGRRSDRWRQWSTVSHGSPSPSWQRGLPSGPHLRLRRGSGSRRRDPRATFPYLPDEASRGASVSGRCPRSMPPPSGEYGVTPSPLARAIGIRISSTGVVALVTELSLQDGEPICVDAHGRTSRHRQGCSTTLPCGHAEMRAILS